MYSVTIGDCQLSSSFDSAFSFVIFFARSTFLCRKIRLFHYNFQFNSVIFCLYSLVFCCLSFLFVCLLDYLLYLNTNLKQNVTPIKRQSQRSTNVETTLLYNLRISLWRTLIFDVQPTFIQRKYERQCGGNVVSTLGRDLTYIQRLTNVGIG